MTSGTLALESRRLLLRIAREAIEARLALRTRLAGDVGEELRQPRGAFVTLRRRSDRDLRGCVGYVEPHYALAEAVARAAIAAATEDGRFTPVTASELPELLVDVSVLGPLGPILAEAVRPGLHGLVIRSRGASGLLLPQVAVEHGWDRLAFLEHTCRKAGLHPDAWKDPEARLYAFMAEVFGEE